jgi:hypothetical protein
MQMAKMRKPMTVRTLMLEKPKLEFAVEIDRQEVYESDDNPKDGDEDSN